MEELITEALSQKRYIFLMQPIYSRSGEIAKYESLVRLSINNNEASLLPGEFFCFAEKQECFGDMLLKSLSNAIALLKKDKNIQIAINMSYKDMRDKELCASFFSILLKEDLETTSRLIVEFIESYEIENVNNVVTFCKGLKQHDVQISIDDFGVKNSNFFVLSIISVDYLKIDGHFVKNLNSKTTYHIVKSIISLCKKLNIKVVAEHIENDMDYSILMELGVDYFQGYYLSKPLKSQKKDFNDG